jgi:ribosomal protein S18 acetylase RimI-like enzyme
MSIENINKIIEQTVNVRRATEDNCSVLLTLDYKNTYDKIFSLSCENYSFTLSEVELPEPAINESSNYTGITDDVIPHLHDENYNALVACLDDKPVGWVLAHWKEKEFGKVLVIQGILVANEGRGKGCAKALINKLITIAKDTPDCVGIRVEMDTTKYHACKLLIKMGFMFSGTELYVWDKNPPTKFSKEVLYFYYPIVRQ